MNNKKHTSNCSRVFKNYDLNCPRCIELNNGSPARDGWQKEYFTNKAKKEQQFNKALKSHNCAKSGCAPICVTFDW